MDFTARIVAKLDTSEAKAELNNFIKKANDPIKLNVEIDKSDFSELSKQFNGIGTKLGRELSLNLNKAINSNKFEVDIDFAKTQANIKSKTEKLARGIQQKLKDSNISIDTQTANKFANKQIRTYDASIQARIKQAKAEAKELEKIQKQISQRSLEVSSSSIKKTLDKYAGSNSKIYGDLEQSYNKLINLQKELTSGVENKSLSKNELLSKFNEFYNVLGKCNNEAKILGNETANISKAFNRSDAITAGNKTLTWLKNNSKAAKEYGEELKQLASLQKNSLDDNELKNYTKQVNQIKAKASAEGKTGLSLSAELKRAASQIGIFAGIYNGIQNIIYDGSREIITAVKDVNAAQIDLIKVSDAPISQLKSYWGEAAESAKKYGATISDVINSTADWTRLGYSLNESKKLSEMTTLYQNVGDNMTQKSASESLVSTLQGFKLSADQAEHIVDVYNEVGNKFAIGSDGIGEALKRSASSMYAAGNTMEETVGLVTAANEVVQDPASIGTAYKTISMRIRGAKTDLENAGLETEGMVESTSKLREEMLALSGVDIMKDKNTFKSTYNILDELSKKWKDLTDIQRASVTELIAGKRQGNIVSALMENFDTARAATETAKNSQGSASRELENWNKGIESSIQHMKAQFQDFSTTLVSSDLFKGVIDGGTKALSVVTDLIDKVGVLPTILGGIGIGSFFKNLDKPKIMGFAL